MSGKRPTVSAQVKPNAQPTPGPMGNTQGIIVPDTGSNPHGNSAPPIQATAKETGWWGRWGSAVTHGVLDVVGLIPVVGEIADGANALIYLAEGDTVNAALSAAAMVPGLGMAATGAKVGKRAVGAAVEGTGKAVGKETAQQASQQGAKKTQGSGGGKDRARGRRQRVKCFCPQDRAKGGRDEYDRQLKHQQDGINAMSVDEYLAQRGGFTGTNPCTGQSVAKAPGRDLSVTRKAKNQRQKEQTQRYSDQFRDQGLGRSDAKRMGSAKAKRERDQTNPLHNQDMVAGGRDVIGDNGVLSDADFGFSDTNQHIGSQWRGDRINSMDAEACRRKQAGEGNEKMNVELRACGKREARAAGCKPSPRK